MSNIRSLSRQQFDVPELDVLWTLTYPEKYWLLSGQFSFKALDHANFMPDLSFDLTKKGELRAFIIAKNDPYGTLFGQPNFNRIHINSFAYKSLGDGEELLQHFLSEAPKSRPIVFGQDQGHFFPGIPEECPGLLALFLDKGFEKQGDLANDLEHDLRDFHPDPAWLEPLNAPDLQVRPCTEKDIPALDEFLQREFPGRWHYDTVIEKCRRWQQPQEIIALWQNDTIEGFAYTQYDHPNIHPTGGFTWHLNLGPHSGALGPIGVSQRVRGRKLGGALLVAGLSHLKSLGVRRCIIDWTSLTDFYGKYGFRVNRRYQPVIKAAQSE